MLELDRRTDRILPNGWCLLPPRQSCVKGNACLSCDKFATDATFLPELQDQMARTGQLIDQRCAAFQARTGHQMSKDNIWLAGRRQEHDALGRIILKLIPRCGNGRRHRRGPTQHKLVAPASVQSSAHPDRVTGTAECGSHRGRGLRQFKLGGSSNHHSNRPHDRGGADLYRLG